MPFTPFAVHGVPGGGTTGQVLAKASADDWDDDWATVAAGVANYLMVGSGSVTPADGAFHPASFTFDNDFAPVGSRFSWAIGDPTQIHVNADGFCAISWYIEWGAGGDPAYVLDAKAVLLRAGVEVGPWQYVRPFRDYVPGTDINGGWLGAAFPAIPVLAGDRIQLRCRNGSAAHDITFDNGLLAVAG
jgi:hypothetical protein